MPDSHYADVRKIHLFSEMSDESFETLMRGSYVQNFPPQIELITENDPSDFLHVVLSGAVELFSAWNGRETTMATVRPVATFILAATIRDAPYLMSARTLEKSRIALIPSQDVRTVFDQDSGFARAMVMELAKWFRTGVNAQKDLKLRTSQERLANYILRQRMMAGGAKSFELSMEKRRLASFLGMTPENLSRALKALQSYGVEVDGTRIHVDDDRALVDLAKPSPVIDDFSA